MCPSTTYELFRKTSEGYVQVNTFAKIAFTNIAFLPPTSLKVLNLAYTRNVLYLPDEIGDLVNLQRIYLEYSGLSIVVAIEAILF